MSQKLFIGGLPFSTSTEELGQLFGQVTGVENIAIVTDRDTGQSRGFGFVEMATNEEAEQAINRFNGKDFDGRQLKVEKASGGAAKPRGGFGGGGPRSSRW